MKPYEEVCFPSGILRWIREGDEYVCRLTEDQMHQIKQLHETPYTKTYSGGKPNYTQPIEREPILPGGGIGRHPDIQARKEGDLIVADLPQVPTGSGGISKDTKPEPILPGGNGGSGVPTIDGWPLYSGLPPIKVQDEREENYKSFAQYDPRRSPSGSWVSWENTMCNPLANARMQTQSAWQDGYDSAKAELAGTEPAAWGVDEGEGRCISLHDLYFVKEDADHMAELKGTHAKVVALYTAPPKKEWVGLTDEEIQAVHYELKVQTQGAIGTIGMYRMLERALREKNNG
jgi:hypothetical protein